MQISSALPTHGPTLSRDAASFHHRDQRQRLVLLLAAAPKGLGLLSQTRPYNNKPKTLLFPLCRGRIGLECIGQACWGLARCDDTGCGLRMRGRNNHWNPTASRGGSQCSRPCRSSLLPPVPPRCVPVAAGRPLPPSCLQQHGQLLFPRLLLQLPCQLLRSTAASMQQ